MELRFETHLNPWDHLGCFCRSRLWASRSRGLRNWSRVWGFIAPKFQYVLVLGPFILSSHRHMQSVICRWLFDFVPSWKPHIVSKERSVDIAGPG